MANGFVIPTTRYPVSKNACKTTPTTTGTWTNMPGQQQQQQYLPTSFQRERYSVARVQTFAGIFGVGPAELVVIMLVATFLFGPDVLMKIGRDAGRIAGELKEIPKEFQKGMLEGEALANTSPGVPGKRQSQQQPTTTTTTNNQQVQPQPFDPSSTNTNRS